MAVPSVPAAPGRPSATRTLVAVVGDWPTVAAGVPADEPAVVLHANRVVACTAAARDEGVAVGLRRREAQSRCPSLTVVEADVARDARTFEPVVAAVAAAVSPLVEVAVPGRIALPTRGPSRYLGGDALLADVVLDVAAAALAERGLPAAVVRVGIADGPFAALHAVGAPPRVVPPGGAPAFLAPLPVAALAAVGLPDDLLDVCHRLGLRTLGDLAAIPAGAVLGRFGPDGATAHRLAGGLDERPPATTAPPPDLGVRLALDPPAERVETAAFAARGLADELATRLARLGLACACVVVGAETDHGERLERRWRAEGSGGASALGASAIADRVRWQLEGWIGGPATGLRAGPRPSAGVAALWLEPEAVVPAAGRQLGFWGGVAAADERAAAVVARLAGLLGPEAVGVPEQRGGRAPGEVVVTVAAGSVVVDGRARATAEAAAPWPGRLPTPLPATVAPTPAPAEVLDATGAPVGVSGRGLANAPPARVRVGGDRAPWREVRAWAGPWPAEERWWDPARHRRRARLQVLDDQGVAHLLTLEAGRWWSEAVYD